MKQQDILKRIREIARDARAVNNNQIEVKALQLHADLTQHFSKTPKVRVEIIESERGWGQKVDEVKEFDTQEEAEEYVRSFNAENNKTVIPAWYMYARIIA